MNKKLLRIDRNAPTHWVGDGFPVRTMFSHHSHGAVISPFLMLDYGGPAEFPPSDKPRGVEEHPHRGFETVTIVYAGEVEHRDSAGGGGLIGPGDVQWMTAASGLVHEEMHGREFSRRGGLFEMVQLWINLPAADKKRPPRYQSIISNSIPESSLIGGAGTARIIAGELNGVSGPADTFTPINVWDLQIRTGGGAELPIPDGQNTLLLVLHGMIELAAGEKLASAELAVFGSQGDSIAFTASEDAKLLLLAGEPIDEPVVAHGPFVMNTQAEIRQAFEDYRSGKMGQLA